MNTTQPQRPDNAQHTPTPWYVDLTKRPAIYGNGTIVAVCEGYLTDGTLRKVGQNEIAANAAFIVRAVNSHAQLVAALEYMVANAEAEGWSEFMLSDARAALTSAQS